MALKPFALILCLPVAEHPVANNNSLLHYSAPLSLVIGQLLARNRSESYILPSSLKSRNVPCLGR